MRSANPGSAAPLSETQEFEAQLSDFDAAQLDAAFADVAESPMTATQQVLPIDSAPAVATAVDAPADVATTVITTSQPVTAAVPANVVSPPAETGVVPADPTASGLATTASTVPVTTQPAAPPSSAAAIVPSAARDHQVTTTRPPSIEGELVAAAPVSGLARQTRLPQVGAVENLLKEIRNPDPVKRRKAIWDLGQWGDTRAVQPLVDLMVDADSKQRSLVLSALSEIGTRTLKPMSKALAISLQDDSPDVRKNAIRDLTRVYDLVSQISQMVQKCALDDPDDEVRDTANWALKQLNRIRPATMDGSLAALSSSVSPPESLPAKSI
ncbi:HEAT repeat domain-containing protein [filamentous cyanobacterium LEGE 11480]|uniref:HEAT repeat domain-containing protein n=2 Tax=Romeriopsis TaxID=2992131 RepID=A0A928VSY5_9CYAN|nr:HEAT repeat domain-containing protein [Romeriopsis navalis LEGE 11480]